MTTRINLGVIGCGVIGQQHIQHASAAARINLVAIADVREAVARDTAQKFNVPATYTSADALLNDPHVAAVVLALPTAGRTELALRALAAGKHVLIEKPVAMNAGEVHQLLAARGKRTVACCQSRLRHTPSAQAAATFIASDALGEIRLVRCRANKPAGAAPSTPPPVWRLNKALNGGGILVNWGCYDFDYLLGLTGWQLQPRQVLAQTWPVGPAFAEHVAPGSDAETHCAAFIRCAGNAVITFERGEYLPAHGEDAWQIIGTKGALRLPMLPVAKKQILFDEADRQAGVVTRTIWEGHETWDMQHTGVIEDFAAAVLDQRPPLATLEHALVVQQITDAIYASAATGTVVNIP